jgi:hypothetical protein
MGVFFRLGIVPPARLWLGVGNCRAGIDATDISDGAVYNGLGEIISVPAFQQLINGAAERVVFALSGVSERIAGLAQAESSAVKGVPLLVGVGVFDADWQLIDPPRWIRRYFVDFPSSRIAEDRDGSLNVVSLSCRSLMTGRRRPRAAFYTDAEQQAKSPGDRFCDRSALYSVDVIKQWPRF